MGWADWPPKDHGGIAAGSGADVPEQIFGTGAPAPTGNHTDLADELFGVAVVERVSAEVDAMFGGPGPSVVEVAASRRTRPPRTSTGTDSSRKLRMRKPHPVAFLRSSEQVDLLRILSGVGAAVLVWFAVALTSSATGIGAVMVTATAAAVSAVVTMSRGWQIGLVTSGLCAVIAVVSAHWWWAGAAALMALGGVVVSGWERR